MSKFEKGQRVITKIPCGYAGEGKAAAGASATVMATDGKLVLLRVEGLTSGHNSHSPKLYRIKKKATDCWWLPDYDIEPAPAEVRALSPKLAAVLNHLTKGLTLTQGEAIILGYGTRLADLIHRLRKRGHDIRMTIKHDIHGTPYGEYKLVTRNRFGDVKRAA